MAEISLTGRVMNSLIQLMAHVTANLKCHLSTDSREEDRQYFFSHLYRFISSPYASLFSFIKEQSAEQGRGRDNREVSDLLVNKF